MPDPSEPVGQWIKKAEGDLRSAQLLLAADPPEPDAVAFTFGQSPSARVTPSRPSKNISRPTWCISASTRRGPTT